MQLCCSDFAWTLNCQVPAGGDTGTNPTVPLFQRVDSTPVPRTHCELRKFRSPGYSLGTLCTGLEDTFPKFGDGGGGWEDSQAHFADEKTKDP